MAIMSAKLGQFLISIMQGVNPARCRPVRAVSEQG